MGAKILGIVGSYRKGGVVDSLVDETLSSAREHGAVTEKVYLLEKHVEFCTNCRTCTQEPGLEPGKCVHDDDMADILARCRKSDGLVIGAPVNYFNVNALTRRFMERLTPTAYWPWSGRGPNMRERIGTRKAVLITSSAMPAIMAKFFTGAVRALKLTASCLGAKPIATVFAGMVAQRRDASPPSSTIRAAREAGRRLAMLQPD